MQHRAQQVCSSAVPGGREIRAAILVQTLLAGAERATPTQHAAPWRLRSSSLLTKPAPTCVLPQRYSPYSSVMDPVSSPPPKISLNAVHPVLIMSSSERCSKICCAVVNPHGTIFWAAKWGKTDWWTH